jgi:hypothetical protein
VGTVGIVTLGVGGALGYWAMRTSSSLADVCGPTRTACPADQQGNIDALKGRALAADVTLGTGAALFATGVILALVAPATKREAPRFHIDPAGLGAQLVGSF